MARKEASLAAQVEDRMAGSVAYREESCEEVAACSAEQVEATCLAVVEAWPSQLRWRLLRDQMYTGHPLDSSPSRDSRCTLFSLRIRFVPSFSTLAEIEIARDGCSLYPTTFFGAIGIGIAYHEIANVDDALASETFFVDHFGHVSDFYGVGSGLVFGHDRAKSPYSASP